MEAGTNVSRLLSTLLLTPSHGDQDEGPYDCGAEQTAFLLANVSLSYMETEGRGLNA